MCRILFPVHLLCSGIFINLQNILFDCFIDVGVTYCIKIILENFIRCGTSVPVVYNYRAIFTVCLGIFVSILYYVFVYFIYLVSDCWF